MLSVSNGGYFCTHETLLDIKHAVTVANMAKQIHVSLAASFCSMDSCLLAAVKGDNVDNQKKGRRDKTFSPLCFLSGKEKPFLHNPSSCRQYTDQGR